MPIETKKVEFLIAWSEGTWTTEIFDIPVSLTGSGEEMEDWLTLEISQDKAYNDAVLFAVYCLNPEGLDDE